MRIMLAVLAVVLTTPCAPHLELVGNAPIDGRVVRQPTVKASPTS